MKPDDASTPAASTSGPRKKSQRALDDYLSTLFPGAPEAESRGGERVPDADAVWIARARIEPNPAQPRRTWSEASLRELGESLARDGQLQACVVRPHPDKAGVFQLVSGERRWRASAPEFGNVERLRCTIREVDDDDAFRLALVQNLQREELNDIDKARAFVDLHASLRARDPRVTWSHVAQSVGLSREYLHRLRALLDLPDEVQEAVRGGTLSSRSARALSTLRDAELQKQMAREAQEAGLSSDQLLERVRQSSAPPDAEAAPATRGARVVAMNAESWEEPLREAVRLLAQARKAAPKAKARARSRRLIEQARAHLEVLARAAGEEAGGEAA